MGQKIRPQKWIATGALLLVAFGNSSASADVCSDVGTEQAGVATQKAEHCKAAKAAKKAAKADKITGGIWAAVAGICVTACTPAGLVSSGICTGSALARLTSWENWQARVLVELAQELTAQPRAPQALLQALLQALPRVPPAQPQVPPALLLAANGTRPPA